MNIVAGLVIFEEKLNNLEKINLNSIWNLKFFIKKNILYILWQTNLSSSTDVLDFLRKFWKLKMYDISISTEDKFKIINVDLFLKWYISTISFDGWIFKEVENLILNKLKLKNVLCIREAEKSLLKEGWRIIKVDIMKF